MTLQRCSSSSTWCGGPAPQACPTLHPPDLKPTPSCRYDLAKAQRRQHLVEGLLRALRQLDAVVATIRAAQDGPAAAAALRSNYQLSAEQVPPRPMPALCVSGMT